MGAGGIDGIDDMSDTCDTANTAGTYGIGDISVSVDTSDIDGSEYAADTAATSVMVGSVTLVLSGVPLVYSPSAYPYWVVLQNVFMTHHYGHTSVKAISWNSIPNRGWWVGGS